MRRHFFQLLWERFRQRVSLSKRGSADSAGEEAGPHRLLTNRYSMDIELAQTLYQLAESEQRSPEDVAADLISSGLSLQKGSLDFQRRWESLSPREQEVAALVCLDYSTNQIANRLCVSPSTVRTHVRNVLYKFGLHSRDELRYLLASWDFHEWA